MVGYENARLNRDVATEITGEGRDGFYFRMSVKVLGSSEKWNGLIYFLFFY